MVPDINLKVTSLDPSLFYLQRLVEGGSSMLDSSEAQRIRIHETSLMFVITNKATTKNIKIISENATKTTHLIAFTDVKYVSYIIFRRYIKCS